MEIQLDLRSNNSKSINPIIKCFTDLKNSDKSTLIKHSQSNLRPLILLLIILCKIVAVEFPHSLAMLVAGVGGGGSSVAVIAADTEVVGCFCPATADANQLKLFGYSIKPGNNFIFRCRSGLCGCC